MLKILMLLTLVLLSFTACRVRLIDPEPTPQENIYEQTLTPTIDSLSQALLQIPTHPAQDGYTPGANHIHTITSDLSALAIEIEIPSPAAGETTLDNDGEGTLGLIIDRYTGLLNSGLGSLFECQRLYVYLENLAPFETVNRNSPEHALITQSGGHNVAARRSSDALTVDAQWLQRRNPAVIIRIVTPDILGTNVTAATAANAARQEILTRPGLEGVTAVLHRRILLLSEELLATDEGRLIAKLYIAHAMYPSLFADVNLREIAEQIRDTGGPDFTNGVFVLYM